MSSPNMALLRSTHSLVLFLSLSLALSFLHAQETVSPGDVITSPIHEGTPAETTYINLITSPPAQGAETTEESEDVTYMNIITSPPAQDVTTPEDPTSMDGTTDVGQPAAAVTQDTAVTEVTAATDPLLDITTSSTVDTIDSEAPTATPADTLTTAVSEEALITMEGPAEALTMTVSETALVTTEGPTDALTTTTTTSPPSTTPQTASIPPASDLATTVVAVVDDDDDDDDDDVVMSLTPNITSVPSQLSTTTPFKKTRRGPIVPAPTPPATSLPPVLIENGGLSLLWIVIVALLAGVMCVGGVICICLLVRRRRRSQSKHLGVSVRSGKWTRKSKGRGEGDDAWAGPVKLRGEEGDGGGEAGKAEEGVRDEEAVVMSTFAAEGESGEGGGPPSPVGEEGSKEVKIWEEEAPLLYIDEDAFDEGLKPANQTNSDREMGGERGSEKGMGGGEGVGNGLSMPGEMNGGSAFCLTTAV